MAITSGLVLYAVLWFLTFLVIIPIRLVTQGDKGTVVPGTHASAPETHYLKQKAIITTVVAALLWALIAGIILSEVISINDMDWLDVYPDPE
ncbi:MAG: DUF1467 family protein [Rhodobacteraceae bacterium]|nr:DUF1467 family protein [Paracoccaceae bacterium]